MSGASACEDQVRVVERIFAVSHGRYDLLNHLLSFRRDIGWRRAAAERMPFRGSGRLLDVATGTADLAIAAALRHPGIAVTGVDVAERMLAIGRRKVRERGLEGRVRLAVGDALALPFPDASFDVSAIAFGLRNIPDRLRALGEMVRVTAGGGRVMVLEMSFAPTRAFRPVYGFYLNNTMPRVAALIARDPATYRYLAQSIRRFPRPEALRATMEAAGLADVRYHRLSFGAAWLHLGRVPPAGAPAAAALPRGA